MERTLEEKSEGDGKVIVMLKQKLKTNDLEQELRQDQPGKIAQFKYKLCNVQFNISRHTSGKQFQPGAHGLENACCTHAVWSQ